jgi:hypothetical protein
MSQPTVSCEKAAVNAFAAHLTTGLGSDVQVWSYWPDANARLTSPEAPSGQPRSTITVLLAGRRQDEILTPYVSGTRPIHDDVTPRVDPDPAITDTASAIAALNDAVASYEDEHRTDTGAHATADATNVVTAPDATDLDSGITLANEFTPVLRAHLTAAAHENPDGSTALAGLAAVSAGDATAFRARVVTLVNALNAHYVARIFQWTVATCKQPLQMDLWAGYDTERDALRTLLEPLLRQNTVATTNGLPDDPVQNSCLVELGDGWIGTADFVLDSPTVIDTPESARRREYRLNYTGTCYLTLDVLAQSPRLAELTLRARLAASWGAMDDTTAKEVAIGTGDTTTISGG